LLHTFPLPAFGAKEGVANDRRRNLHGIATPDRDRRALCRIVRMSIGPRDCSFSVGGHWTEITLLAGASAHKTGQRAP